MFVEQNLIKGALTRTLTEAEANSYRAPFVDPEKRFPIYVWPNELPIAGKPSRNVKVINEIGAWLKSAKTPKLLQYVSPKGNYSTIGSKVDGHQLRKHRNSVCWLRQTLYSRR